jgi:DNA primase
MDAVEEIKGRLAIEDVLSEYVQLKRAGRNFKGLSPFSNERTPSFVVSPEKQIWHDFSSGKGGDVFTFIQEMEGVDFRGSLDILARKAGIELEQYKSKGRDDNKQKERLYHLLEQVTKFYQANLKANKSTLDYVINKRKFTKETILEWQLGYSPNTGSAAVDFAKKQGFTPKEIQQAGLTNRFGGDMFRGRLMVPLQDQQGRVVGFTARLLINDPQAPKYINTPQTPLYDKSRHVFGLHLAKESIRKTKYVLLAEGNLDVIASHQAGVKQCVATAGTALTEQQLKTLKRFTGDVRLCFDADRAGLAATERAIPIASKVGVQLSVITIPNGKDPDELIRQDKDAWKQVVEQPQYALDWLIGHYQMALDLTKPGNKLVFSDTVLTVIRTLGDRVEQEHYVQKVADIIDVSREALLQMKLDHTEKPLSARQQTKKLPTKDEQESLEVIKKQDKLMALILLQPRTRDLLESVQPEFLPQERAQFVFRFLKEHPDFDGTPTKAVGLKEQSEYVKMLSLQYEELYQGIELLELRNEAEYLQSELVKQYVETQKSQNKRAYHTATPEEERALLAKDKELNELLSKYKGGNYAKR